MSTISGVSSSSSSSSDIWANMKAQRSQMQAKMFAKVDTDSSGGVDKTELQSMLDDVAKKSGVTNSSSTDALFSKMDANSDGSLSSDELGKGMKEILPPPSTMDFAQSRNASTTTSTDSADNLFSKIDTDASGSVSKAELQSLMDKMKADSGTGSTSATSDTSSSSDDLFAKLDSDGDGSLSGTEFKAARPQGGKGPQAAGGVPPPPPPGGAGGAGAAGTSTTYDPLDTNEDGTVSAKERLAGSTSTDAVQTLLKAIDTDGDKKISASESDNFMKQLSSQLASGAQSAQNTDTTGSDSQTDQSNIDLATLVTKAYEQIANGLKASATLSAIA